MKMLEEFLTRDASFIAIESWWYKGFLYFKDFFGFNFPKVIFISKNGTFIAYRDNKELMDKFLDELNKWLKINKKKISLIHKVLVDGLEFFEKIEINKQTSAEEILDYLDKAKEHFTKGCLGVFIVHWLPIFQDRSIEEGKRLFDEKLIKKIIGWRESEGNIYFNEGVNTFYFLLEEIAKRKKWDKELLKYITHEELVESIRNDKPLPLNKIKKRKNSVFAYINEEIVYEPEIKERLESIGCQIKEEEISKRVKEIKGVIANKGRAKGIVRVIFNRQQLDRFNENEILVAPMTSQWYMSSLKKAVAIVTDEGGITCHAAIISRELKIPCVIGTKIATKVLKDGDLVEVDAENGIVKIIKKMKK